MLKSANDLIDQDKRTMKPDLAIPYMRKTNYNDADSMIETVEKFRIKKERLDEIHKFIRE